LLQIARRLFGDGPGDCLHRPEDRGAVVSVSHRGVEPGKHFVVLTDLGNGAIEHPANL
jgi:hypothetical protein